MKKIFLTVITLVIFATLSFFSSGVASAEMGNNNCETDTSVISCDSRLDSSGQPIEGIEGTGLWSLLLLVLNIMAGGVGIAALAGLVYGSALYASANGKPDQLQKATAVFTGIIYGVITFAAMWSILNFLIPGGVFA